MLTDCFDTMKLYGKEPEQLGALCRVFKRVLGEYPWYLIECGFEDYLKRNDEMPTPADIVNLIDPPLVKKKFSPVAFLDIKRRSREGQFITNAEKQYCEDFIDASVNGDPDERGGLLDAMKKAQIENNQYFMIEG